MRWDQETNTCLTPRNVAELMQGQDGLSRLQKWPRQRQRGWRELGLPGKGASRVGCPPHHCASRPSGATSDAHSAKSSGHALAPPPGLLPPLNPLALLPGQLLLCPFLRPHPPDTQRLGRSQAQDSDLISTCASLGDLFRVLVFKTISRVMAPA